jgi:hypothetical protein
VCEIQCEPRHKTPCRDALNKQEARRTHWAQGQPCAVAEGVKWWFPVRVWGSLSTGLFPIGDSGFLFLCFPLIFLK